MINLQLNHEQIINFSKNAARCTCPGTYRWTHKWHNQPSTKW